MEKESHPVVLKKKKSCYTLYAWWKTGVPPTWMVVAGALVVQVGFGLYPVIVRKFAQKANANPLIFSFYRDAICSPLLFVCALVAERKILIPTLRMLWVLVLLGLLGMFGNQLLYILGVYWVGPNVASAFQPIIPVWTTVLAVLSCTERLPSPFLLHTWVKVAGILLATTGAIELTVTGQSVSNSTIDTSNSTTSINFQVLGYVSLFGNTFCMAIYVLMQKKLIFNKLDCNWREYPVSVTAYSYTFGAIFMGLSTIYYAASNQTDVFILPEGSWFALIYAVFITSALCYLLITWSNMHLSTTIVTAFWPFQVLIAVLASYFITGDVLAPWQYLGAVLLVGALFLVLFSNHMEERLADGKSVIRLDCCKRQRKKKAFVIISSKNIKEVEGINDEKESLLSSSTPYDKSCQIPTDGSMNTDKPALN